VLVPVLDLSRKKNFPIYTLPKFGLGSSNFTAGHFDEDRVIISRNMSTSINQFVLLGYLRIR
jgi:hypothetical protein